MKLQLPERKPVWCQYLKTMNRLGYVLKNSQLSQLGHYNSDIDPKIMAELLKKTWFSLSSIFLFTEALICLVEVIK